MRIAALAAAAAALAGCSVAPAQWSAEMVPVITGAPAPARSKPCAALDPAIGAEAERLTPLAGDGGRNTDALTASLMQSEVAKNARLRQVLAAYERCRRP